MLVTAYVGLEWLSFLHEHDGLPVTPWNPGLGLMFATIILKGRHFGAVFFIGVVLSELLLLQSNLSWPIIIAVGLIVATAYTTVAEIARKYLVMSALQFHTRDILVIVAAGLVGATVTSIMLTALLLSISRFDISDIATTAAPLILGDLIGIVVVTPLVLRAYLHRHRLSSLQPPVLVEFVGVSILILASLAIIMLSIDRQGNALFYLLFLPIVVAAVRHGIDGACAALAFAQLALVGALHLREFDLSRFTEYQLLMLVLTLTGLIVGALVSERQVADEAARKAAEQLHEMQAVAARTARLNLISGMAAAIAHEVNQPMTAARALARSVQQLLHQPGRDLERAARNVASMIEQIDHAGAVIRRMREFLRRGEPHVSTVQVREVLVDAAALIRPLMNARRIRFALDAPNELPSLFADRVQVQQVIMNLMRNSVESIFESGQTDGAVSLSARLAVSGNEIEISVEDNGPGIAQEQVDRIFEPLTTTRPDGIGLGLSICQMIVQAHGGRIWLSETKPGRTVFRFTLPISGDTPRKVET